MSYKITDENIETASNAYRKFVDQMGPKRYIHTSENLRILGDFLERSLKDGENITLEHWLQAWLESTGLLQEPLTEAELKAVEEEKTKERNARLEAKDRRSGRTVVDSQGRICNSHLSESEKEELLEKSMKDSKEEYKKAVSWIRGEADRRNQPQELAPTAIDAASELNNILSPVTVSSATKQTKQEITKWMRNTESKLVLMARRNNPDWASKMD